MVSCVLHLNHLALIDTHTQRQARSQDQIWGGADPKNFLNLTP